MPDWHRLKWYGVLAVGVLFSVTGIAMAMSGDRSGWIGFFFFLVCAAVAAHQLWPQVIERHVPTNPDTILEQYPGPVTLRVPRFKLVFILVATILFGGSLGWAALYSDMGAAGLFFMWLGAIGCAIAVPIFLVSIIRGATLRLDADGMQIFQGLKRSNHRWTDLSEFSVADAGVLTLVRHPMVMFDETGTKDGRIAGFNRSLLGKSGGLPDTYGMEPWHLAWLLNEWRARALGKAAPSRSAYGPNPPPPPQSPPAP